MALVDGKSTHYTSGVDRATGTPTVKHLRALRTYAAIANGVDGRRRGRGRPICALRTFCTGLLFVEAFAFAQPSAAAGDANPAAAGPNELLSSTGSIRTLWPSLRALRPLASTPSLELKS